MIHINLGKINEAIEWSRNDEIGSLVKEYNKMLSKLDESASALAKTEREGAWKEIAKQVAHGSHAHPTGPQIFPVAPNRTATSPRSNTTPPQKTKPREDSLRLSQRRAAGSDL